MPCCPGVLVPSTLYLTIFDGTLHCTCLEGTYPLAYSGSNAFFHFWFFQDNGNTCGAPLQNGFQRFTLSCRISDQTWGLSVTCDTSGENATSVDASSASCDPFALSFTFAFGDFFCCYRNGQFGSFEATVTP